MTTHPPEWYVGMDADTIARARANDANLQGIINGRRRAALKLVATDMGPARQVEINTAPLLGDKYQGWVPKDLEIPYIPPPGSGHDNDGPGAELFTGEGPPNFVPGASIGDEYLDSLTGLVYTLTTDNLI